MSGRNRTGEMRLEMRCLLLFGFFFLLVTGASFGMWWYVTETLVWDQSPKTGHEIANQAMLSTHWERLEALANNESFVPVIKQLREDLNRRQGTDTESVSPAITTGASRIISATPPTTSPTSPTTTPLTPSPTFDPSPSSPDAILPEDGTVTPDFLRKLMRFDHGDSASPAAVIPDPDTMAAPFPAVDTDPISRQEEDSDETSEWVPQVRWSILSVDPNCTDVACLPRNAFEQEVVNEFANRPKPHSLRTEYREDIWSKVYHYYEPIRASQSCSLVCHCTQPDLPGVPGGDPVGGASAPGGRPWKEGDVMGIVHVELPTRDVREQIRFWWSVLLSAAILTMFFAIVAFYGTIRYLIVRPLRHLREVTDAISAGNLHRRADLHSGDVFETLGMALNRMLSHLVKAQEELRLQSRDLDEKVDQLAHANIFLHEMNQARGDFLATMSHELRTPLNSIIGFSDILRQVPALNDRQRRYVENIGRSGRQLLEMINDVLDLAKLENGRMEAEPTEFHIAEVVGAQCDIAMPLAERKKIDLGCVAEPDLPVLFQDRGRVQQILNNLLSNAIRFTPDGGRIRIMVQRLMGEAYPATGMMELRVIDTGVGISVEDQKTIFQKFRQGRTAIPGEDVLTREVSGTGLGLSIVRELCQLLGGEISVESELGTGSIFTVRIPWRYQRRIDILRDEVSGITEVAPPSHHPDEPNRSDESPSPAAPLAKSEPKSSIGPEAKAESKAESKSESKAESEAES